MHDGIKLSRLENLVKRSGNGDILDNCKLELSVITELVAKKTALGFRANGPDNVVSLFQKGLKDCDGKKTVGTSK